MAGMRREVEALVRCLVSDHGCEVTLNRSGHWRVARPGVRPVTLSRSPSDHRALANMKRDLRISLGIRL